MRSNFRHMISCDHCVNLGRKEYVGMESRRLVLDVDDKNDLGVSDKNDWERCDLCVDSSM